MNPLVNLLGKDGLWSTPAASLPTQFWVDVVSAEQIFIYYIPDKSKNLLIHPILEDKTKP